MKLDLNDVKEDIKNVMTTSQDWWPADTAIMAHFSFAWHGIVQAHTGPLTVAAVPMVECRDLHL